MSSNAPPRLVLTQGDPAGIGPEILVRVALDRSNLPRDAPPGRAWRPLLVLERAAIAPLRSVLPDLAWDRLRYVDSAVDAAIDTAEDIAAIEATGGVPALDPGTRAGDGPTPRPRVVPGQPSAADARGALAALDRGVELVRSSVGDALVTAPLSKAEIAQHVLPDFRGHTDYLAHGAGLERYGRDYLMAFLSPSLRVALLSTHVPLQQAIDGVTRDALLDALRCLARHGGAGAANCGSIAVAGLDPHAGEGGLLGTTDRDIVRPAIEQARAEGIDAHGPESADSLFARARGGAFRWVLALYHDQGLIAVKTAAFGEATNWTLGLPYLRTSVDHGTAYDLAGRGEARCDSLRAVIDETLGLLAG